MRRATGGSNVEVASDRAQHERQRAVGGAGTRRPLRLWLCTRCQDAEVSVRRPCGPGCAVNRALDADHRGTTRDLQLRDPRRQQLQPAMSTANASAARRTPVRVPDHCHVRCTPLPRRAALRPRSKTAVRCSKKPSLSCGCAAAMPAPQFPIVLSSASYAPGPGVSGGSSCVESLSRIVNAGPRSHLQRRALYSPGPGSGCDSTSAGLRLQA